MLAQAQQVAASQAFDRYQKSCQQRTDAEHCREAGQAQVQTQFVHGFFGLEITEKGAKAGSARHGISTVTGPCGQVVDQTAALKCLA